MTSTIIDKLYADNTELVKFLKQNGEISFQTNVEDILRKTLLLASASYFESILTEDLINFCGEHTSTANVILEFIKAKAITRQYHTFFDWEKKNANKFFALFGEEFKTFIAEQVKKDTELDEAIQAFLELGNYRNSLIHQNFANFNFEKTSDEIYALYIKASKFVEVFPSKLDLYLNRKIGKSSDEPLSLT